MVENDEAGLAFEDAVEAGVDPNAAARNSKRPGRCQFFDMLHALSNRLRKNAKEYGCIMSIQCV